MHAINKGADPQVNAVVTTVAAAAPDVIALQGVDFDHGGAALTALGAALAQAGHDMPYRFAAQPNTGVRTGLDHDGDGFTDGARDAQGFGRFTGQGGMAVLSRFPLGEARDFSMMLWKDLPGAVLPRVEGALFPSETLYQVQRLSSVAHWQVPVLIGEARLDLLTFHATPPVFDGPEDRNGLRNHDEIRFWSLLLDGALPWPAPQGPFVIAGDANLDANDGEGLRAAIRDLLVDPRLQDPRPGDGALTAHWGDLALRVDYVLPALGLEVPDTGVIHAPQASRHDLVWVDVALP